MPLHQPVTPVPVPLAIGALPVGRYGISYDLFTRKMTDIPPSGWASHTGTVYRRLGNCLKDLDYRRAQYSVFHSRLHRPASWAWADMMLLRSLLPPGMIPSVVRRLQIYHVPHNVVFVTRPIRLGGLYSLGLTGPTPADLVPGNVPSVPGTAYGEEFEVPEGVRDDPQGRAHDPENWKCPLP